MSSAKRPQQAGFSLVETVAAMGILAMAAIPLLQVTTEANRNAASLEMRLLARTVAENEMARAMASGTILDAGVATGQATQLGRNYTWTRTTSRAQLGELQTLTVEVRPSTSEQVLARLEGLKYIPQSLTGTLNQPNQQNGEGQ
ncbi:MAG: type II secretion system minor pseudopilin GspI [Pseudomonadota bacterium]